VSWSGFDHEVVEARPGLLVFRVEGRGAAAAFAHEPGGHRWQRTPPTEKRGRVHTSTVTIAVLEEPTELELYIDPRDLHEEFVRGQGAGGQHRNKTDTCVVLHHAPSNITVRVDGGRSQHINRQTALALLRARLKATAESEARTGRNASRRDQVGGGARGDKVRTIAIQRDQVTHHETGKTMTAARYLRGNLRDLW
jgi:peptide chain release factor 1